MILLKEYPNSLLKSSVIKDSKTTKNIFFISSTDNFWVSKSMFKKWLIYSEGEGVNLHIYSNADVNNFMEEYFRMI